ncbi:MAG: hypothetical protein ACTSV2_08940 [Candidatus Thorarchaeota archaeon]
MGKTEVICPNCSKKKFKVETHKKTEEFKKVKGGIYYRSTLQQISHGVWTEDPNKGVGVQCKCGLHFFLTNFGNLNMAFEISNSLPEGHTFAVYCDQCGRAFISPDLKCPTCGGQY